jgi:hypothetical protein
MNAQFPGKASTPTQVDYSKRRHPPAKDDLEMNAAGRALLASIEESARPTKLAALFPRIVNQLAKLWKMPREMDRYFEELLTDTRGSRQGFSLPILMELGALKDYYRAKLYPTRRDVWDS